MEMNQDYWVNQSKSFDQAADYYDKFRPSYPQELISDIISLSGVHGESRILEIGAGSGKATELFVDRGLNVTCIEPGERLAREGQRRFRDTGRVRYVVTRFEDWDEDPAYYDLAVSAQAFHWVPKPLGYEKCHSALKPGGRLGLFWNFYLATGDAVEREIQELFKEYPVAYLLTEEGLKDRIQSNVTEIEASRCFQGVEVRRYPWSQVDSTADYIGFLRTSNGYLTLDAQERIVLKDKVGEILERHGGRIQRAFECTLFMAKNR